MDQLLGFELPAFVVPDRPFRLEQVGVGELALLGEVDAFGADALLAALQQATANGWRRVQVDLGGAEFLDHHALAALACFGWSLLRRGGELRLSAASPTVVRIWQLLDYGAAARFE